MRRRALRQLGATLAACVLAAACEGPTQPARSNPPPPVIDPRPVLDSLAGSYTVTVNLSEQCAEIPLAVRQRRYQASLETTPYQYLGVRIVGGGFSDPIVIGDLWPAPDGRVTLSWNDFDLGGCDDVYLGTAVGRKRADGVRPRFSGCKTGQRSRALLRVLRGSTKTGKDEPSATPHISSRSRARLNRSFRGDWS